MREPAWLKVYESCLCVPSMEEGDGGEIRTEVYASVLSSPPSPSAEGLRIQMNHKFWIAWPPSRGVRSKNPKNRPPKDRVDAPVVFFISVRGC